MTPKTLQQMAWPLVISFTLRFLFSLVDLAYAAALADDSAGVAAISFYIPFQAFYIAVWVGLSAGFTATLANAFGHEDESRVAALQRAMLQILTVLVPVLLLYGAGIWWATPHLGLEPHTAQAFRIYATTLAIGMPLTGFWAVYPDSIVKAHHDTRSTMVAGLLSTFTNLALNTLFVFAFGWGIFGIAVATVLSRLPALAYAMRRARQLEHERRLNPWPASQHAWSGPVRAILRLAVPGSTTYVLTAFEGAVVNTVLTRLPDSTTAIASYGVYDRMMFLALMPAIGTSVAVIPYVARSLPQGRTLAMKSDLRRTLLALAALAVVVTICVGWVFAEPIATFLVKGEAGEVAPQARALAALRLLPLAALATLPFVVLRPVFESAQRPRLGVLVSVLRFAILSPPLIFAGHALAPSLGIDGVLGVILGVITATLLASAVTAVLAWRTLETSKE